jgi:hypothetical protein
MRWAAIIRLLPIIVRCYLSRMGRQTVTEVSARNNE